MDDDNEVNINPVEYTLESTYERLKELKREKEREIQQMIISAKNNEVRTLKPDTTVEEICQKRHQFLQSLQKLVALEQPKNVPIPNTADIYSNALKELEDEVHAMNELHKVTDEEIAELEANISYMEKKKLAFEQVKESSLNAVDSETTNYEAEMVVTKKVFQEVKKDLESVVETLFPGNNDFQELLCILTRALTSGGDDLYIDVSEKNFDFVTFLYEADIIQFHPHDNNKIKLRNL